MKRLLPLVVVLCGCELLNGNPITQSYVPPAVALNEATLMRYPSIQQIGAWYCPQYGDPGWCAAFLGAPPPREEMAFRFDLHYALDNPNQVPIPTTEILVALRVFQGLDADELGAVCVVLCNDGDPKCDPIPKPGSAACRDARTDVDTIEEFAEAAVNFVVALGVAAASGEAGDFVQHVLPKGGKKVPIVVHFAIDIDAMLSLVTKFAGKLIDDWQSGKDVRLEIPYSARGTLWFELPIVGRVPVTFGPLAQAWVIE